MMSNPKDNVVKSFVQGFLQFIDASPTPFHCVENAKILLDQAGFTRISERTSWSKEKLLFNGGKYYYTRNDSSLVAFCVGNKYEAGNAFKVVGAHTDSPVLKVKPNANRKAHGLLQLGVECYGGGLWHTWLDRDLGVAGKVILKGEDSLYKQSLTAQERKSLELNKEDHLTPILGLIEMELNAKEEVDPVDIESRYAPIFLNKLAEEIGCNAKDIIDLELTLFDTQKAAVGGVNEEFIFSPRIDNQSHSFTSIMALIDYSKSDLVDDEDVSVAVLFDHEEVGSSSAFGAGSPLMRDAVERISECFSALPDTELFRIALDKSLLLSADAAHAIHPNYAAKHELLHQPKLGAGTVIKTNANQRYATNAVSGFIVRELCRKHKLPFQEFVVRNDCPCGSTIGPIIASNTGIRTVDIGIPQLSMHSIRETCSTVDLYNNLLLLRAFYSNGTKVDKQLALSSF